MYVHNQPTGIGYCPNCPLRYAVLLSTQYFFHFSHCSLNTYTYSDLDYLAN